MKLSFAAIAATFAASLITSPAMAKLEPAQIVTNIKTLTSKSQMLQAPAQSISIINGPLIVIGQGPFPQLIAGFSEIVVIATTAITQMQGTLSITSEGDSTAIANAFREFVRVHQVLLNILIGKAGLFSTVPIIGAPVAAVLRQIENVVDTIAFSLIDIVEMKAKELKNDQGQLSMTINTAINSYAGLSVSKVRRELPEGKEGMVAKPLMV